MKVLNSIITKYAILKTILYIRIYDRYVCCILSCLIYYIFDDFSETLDEHNPWFCPKCGCNQCATKTLTVHRYPKFLIVYLKRYV